MGSLYHLYIANWVIIWYRSHLLTETRFHSIESHGSFWVSSPETRVVESLLGRPDSLGRKFAKKIFYNKIPRHPVIFSADDWGVQSPPKSIVFGFHDHSQKVIGFLGDVGIHLAQPIRSLYHNWAWGYHKLSNS